MNPILEMVLAFVLLYWGVSLIAVSLIGDNVRVAIMQRLVAAVALFALIFLVLR